MNFIKTCQDAYYAGAPIISDEEYDALVSKFPEGEHTIGTTGDTPHLYRMWSLEKKYPCRGDTLPTNLNDYIESPKLDGCAVSALFMAGKPVLGLTRGDGIQGKNILHNLRHLLPKQLSWSNSYFQVSGEVVVTKPEGLDNVRNYASGAINTKDEAEFLRKVKEAGLMFVVYNVQYEGSKHRYYSDLLDDVSGGFNTILSQNVLDLVADGKILTDGTVYRLNNNAAFHAAGFTSKFPKGAFAVKEDAEGETTTIEDILWQVGASGKVTPVAIVKEIVLEDAKVTRVTLNNLEYMKLMNITHIGQKVRVIRAGGIIPKIVEAY